MKCRGGEREAEAVSRRERGREERRMAEAEMEMDAQRWVLVPMTESEFKRKLDECFDIARPVSVARYLGLTDEEYLATIEDRAKFLQDKSTESSVQSEPPQWALDAIRAVMEFQGRVIAGDYDEETCGFVVRESAMIIASFAPGPLVDGSER